MKMKGGIRRVPPFLSTPLLSVPPLGEADKIQNSGYCADGVSGFPLYRWFVPDMRVLKDDKYEAILRAARSEFIRKGYKEASMRAIAAASGVGLSNVYNYFPGKDGIYAAVVGPARDELFLFIVRQHGEERVDFNRYASFGHCDDIIDDYIDIIERYREELRLLFYGSDGSSMGGFREAFTDHLTQVSSDYMALERRMFPQTREVSPCFIHALSSWMVSVVGEIVAHELDRHRIRDFFREYFRFEFAGWRELTGN